MNNTAVKDNISEQRLSDQLTSSEMLALVMPQILSKRQLFFCDSVLNIPALNELDEISGIDFMTRYVSDTGISYDIGNAIKIQYGSDYKTMTMRTQRSSGNATEYHKRKEQLSIPGAFYPFYHWHLYVKSKNDPTILSVAKIETAELITLIDQVIDDEKYIRKAHDTNGSWQKFVYLPYDYLEKHAKTFRYQINY